MASLTIRRLDEGTKAKLRLRAATHGRSMEEEARRILQAGLTEQHSPVLNLAASIRKYVEPFGGVELRIAPREAARKPPKLS